jgi:hypothetical protein
MSLADPLSISTMNVCPCFRWWKVRGEKQALQRKLQCMRDGGHFSRAVKRMLLSTREKVVVKLSPDFDTVLLWRKDDLEEGGRWHEEDLTTLKTVQVKESGIGFVLLSRTGETILDLEAENEILRDEWVEGLTLLKSYLKENPQDAAAHRNLQDRVMHTAQRQGMYGTEIHQLLLKPSITDHEEYTNSILYETLDRAPAAEARCGATQSAVPRRWWGSTIHCSGHGESGAIMIVLFFVPHSDGNLARTRLAFHIFPSS